jgi:hypothetical protein
LEVSGQLHAPASLPTGKEPRCQLDRRLCGPHIRSGQHAEVKILTPTTTVDVDKINYYKHNKNKLIYIFAGKLLLS